MPVLRSVMRHWVWTLVVVIVAVVLCSAAWVWFFVLRTPATRVGVSQALRTYRAEQRSGTAGAATHLPPSGVYQYQTSGGEQLSMAGISRPFPGNSELIVTDDAGCTTMKWEPLVQHTEGWVACRQRDGALSITSAPSYEQIAGTQNTTVIRCPAGMYFLPPDPRTGERWRTTCHSPGETVVFSGEVLGTGSVKVGSVDVPALHTEILLTFSGTESGTNPNTFWISSDDGLILSQEETADFSQKVGPLGSVRYTEQMQIRLKSTVPLR